MNTPPLSSVTGSAKYADVPLDRLAANPKVPQGEKLAAACKAFEAVLLRQILESAQKQVVASNLTPSSASSSIYRDLISSQMADQIAATGQFGLARSFLDQIKSRQPKTAPAAPAAAPTAPGSVGSRDFGPAIPEPKGFTAAATPETGATRNTAPAGARPESQSPTSPLASSPILKPFLSGPDLKAYRHE